MANFEKLLSVTLFAVLAVGAWAATYPPSLDKALQAQYEILRERPTDPVAHNDLGNLLVVANRLGEAESSYQRAKELDPTATDVRYNLGLLLHQLGRLDDSREELFSLIELDPEHAWGHYHLGMVFFEEGNRKSALEYYARSFALDPTLTFARHNPHIIDNELATEALLVSSRYGKPATNRMPRRYGEADRIADLMLEHLEKDEAAKDPEDDVPGDEAGSEGEMSEGGEMDPAAVTTRRRGSAYFDPEDDMPAEDPEGGGAGEPSGERRLTNDDLGSEGGGRNLGGSNTGYYRPPARGDSGDRNLDRGRSGANNPEVRERIRRPPTARGRSGEGNTTTPRGGRAQGGAVILPQNNRPPANPSASRQRFRPGSSSSARLSLELLPIEVESTENAADSAV